MRKLLVSIQAQRDSIFVESFGAKTVPEWVLVMVNDHISINGLCTCGVQDGIFDA